MLAKHRRPQDDATGEDRMLSNTARVRYIKLGERGRWEERCLTHGVIHIGFGSARPDRLAACFAGRWDDVRNSFVAEGASPGTATRSTNELRFFFVDDGATVWISFIGQRLYWGRMGPGRPAPVADLDGVTRKVEGGWRSTDLNGDSLTMDRLSGALTKLVGYRGTSCAVEGGVRDYLIRRINGQKTPEVERAIAATTELTAAVTGLMTLLEPKDFELLVDLVFTNSGWRRINVVGKTQKTLDLDLILPSTGERALVQVKSETSSRELAEYQARIDYSLYHRMFFVFHSGEAETLDSRVSVIGPNKLANLIIDAGLTNWLIGKVS